MVDCVDRCVVAWCVMLDSVAQCGVVWCTLVWCGVAWCGVMVDSVARCGGVGGFSSHAIICEEGSMIHFTLALFLFFVFCFF